jgi:mono/diheme cytochrome c family protein
MRNTIFIVGAALVCLAFSGCRGWITDERPIHPNPNMDTQEKLKPYRKSDFFADGRAMRMPVEGTIARTVSGSEPLDADFLALDPHRYEGAVNGSPAAQFPSDFQGTATNMKRGQQRYNIYCAPCHGQDGNGQGAVARRLSVKPPTFHQQRIWDLPVGSIFQTITHGKNVPNMPAYNTQLPVSDRWAVVYYMRALMASQNPSLSLYPVAAVAEAQAGENAEPPAEEVAQ